MDTQVITILVGFLVLLGGMWKIARDFEKDLSETSKEITRDLKDTVALLFKRFDDHKKDMDKKLFYIQNTSDEKYVRLDLCNKTSGNIEGRLKSIDIKLDTLLKERRND